ncbi:MAG TPA: amino acid adenylation domain-containing protein [Thermoanaerobaculia bacterium]|nr:amino acid adenylation domain-containing protein [Thermoanaerobaculia bacterium]
MAPELRAYLGSRLPEYMVPPVFVPLDALPLSPTGKVDRRRLPAPELSRREGAAFVAPRTPVERKLARIFAELLGMERIGAGDNFFELGGHSLLATQVVSRAREAFRVEVPLRALFQAPTVAGLAERIEAERRAGTGLAAPPIVPVPRQGLENGLPLSFAQQRLWFIDQMEPGTSLYNIATALRMTGRLDLVALAGSFGEVVRRHESLRTVFGEVEGVPVQRVLPPAAVIPPVVDLSGLEPGRREGSALALAAAEAQLPFDLARGPLFRLGLLRLSGEEHVVLLTMHHVISDGWSMGVLVREVAALYPALLAGGPLPLPELPVQYADFAEWQRRWLGGGVLERELAYWKGQLSAVPPALPLPTDRPRPPVQSFRGAARALRLPEALAQGLRALGLRHEATLFMTLLAVFQALLARYSSQWNVSVGTPVAGRNHKEIEGLIGFFVNTLVLRTDLSGDPRFDELLGRVREVSLAAQTHQEVPFEKLVEELEPVRSLSHAPLFQVMLALQNALVGDLELPGLTVTPLPGDGRTAKFDLTLFLEEKAGGLTGALEYSRDLFEAPTIERLLGHFRTLLEGAVAAPAERLSELPLLSRAERQELLRDWSTADAGEPPAGTLPELFEAQVRRSPEAIALVATTETLTYRQLNAHANQLARRLRRLGVGPDVVVGLLLERSPEMVAGALGVLKAGGAYLPLDPAYPRERLAFMAEDAGVQVLLTTTGQPEPLPSERAKTVHLDAERDALAAYSDRDLAGGELAENLAYVIYTSGSTGRPKGVMVQHQGLVNYVTWAIDAYGVDAACVSPVHSSLGFDLTVTSLFPPLLAGGRVVLVPEEQGIEGLGTALRQDGDQRLIKITPAHLALLREELAEVDLSARTGTVVVGGEALSGKDVSWWRRSAPGLRLINEYGPTEAVVGCCVYEVREADPAPGAVPIGRPIAHAGVRLLDRNQQPVPAGIPGELYVGGAGVVRGYLGHPGLTAERFVPDPFGGASDVAGGRLYRTGDLARYLPGGELEYLGRYDDQVKIRGFRIELGEIEAVLAGHPGVRAVAVLAREDVPGGARLVAYLVFDRESPPSIDELRGFLTGKLPAYMLPAVWMVLESLPLTPNGKVDRRALPAPAAGQAGDSPGEPRTATEELLAGIWAQVLGRERVGVSESFFDLGGHSLLATQVMSRLRQALTVELPLRALFEAPTVAGLAQRVEAAWRRGEGLEAPPIQRVTRDGELPLSFAQQRLWFIDQLEPGSPLYNIPVALQLSGRLDLAALVASLREIVRRHEVLRTRLEAVAGRPRQVIERRPEVALPVVDLSGLYAGLDRESEARRLMRKEARRPFDLQRGPLLRSLLLRLDPRTHVASLTLHHVVSDGWSTGVLVRELSELYAAALEGRPARLPELPVQYADFAHWQRRWLTGRVLEEQLAYWRDRLAGAQAELDLPSDRPRPPVQSSRGASQPLAFRRDLGPALRELSRRQGATLFMTLLAAYQVLLQRYTGRDDLPVGSLIANRNRGELEELIGFFVNTLVMRGDLAEDPPFRDLMARAREVALGAYAHQDLPFEKLVEELQPARSLGHSPFFQTMLVLQNTPLGALVLPALELTFLESESDVSLLDLTVMLEEGPAGLRGRLEYSTDLFDEVTIQRLGLHLEVLLRGIAADSDQRLSSLPLLTAAERHQLVLAWNDTTAPFPRHRCLHELLAERVAATPEEPALIYGRETLSFRELDRRAGRLARRLRALGVGPEVVVAICVERSPEMAVAFLGVLQAGGAYVPLDPSYPPERLAFLLVDSRAPVLLTQERLVAAMPAHSAHILCLDRELEAGVTADGTLQGLAVPENPAYVIYTSGSTGRPKGVVVPHAALVHYTLEMVERFRLGPGDRVLQFAALGFDVVVEEVFPAWLAGATVVLAEAERLASPPDLRRVIEEHGVTVMELPAAYWHEWVHQLSAASVGLPPSLRLVIVGSEKPLPERLATWRAFGIDLIYIFGLTETTVTSSLYDLRAGAEPGSLNLPIGRPVGNTGLYVLDRELMPSPIGVSGELCVAGAGVARGYLGRPDLTAGRFIPDPFSAEPGARMYRTGDLARLRPDGNLDFLGRIDQQMKIRGFRIEPGEVEAALVRHPAVREAVVVAREERGGSKALAAYVVAQQELSPKELRPFLLQSLPEYMVPSTFTLLDRLPLTPHGKLDRVALPAPGAAQSAAGGPFAAPGNLVEEVLAAIWCELLGIDRAQPEDDFFELGGHSLLATQAMSRLRQAFGVELPLRDLFEAPLLAALARRVEAALQRHERLGSQAIERSPRDGELPLSFAQQRLWLAEQLEPGGSHFNLPSALRIAGHLDTAALERSLSELARRHETLRTTFVAVDGRPLQVIAPPAEQVLPWVDLEALPPVAREAETLRLADAEARRPFDLATGPLWRATLLRLAAREHVLLMTMHHIVSDAWSMGVLIQESVELYTAIADRRPIALPELPIQYADFAAWQRRELQGEKLEALLSYWRQRLSGAPALLELPFDRPRPAVPSYRGAHHLFTLGGELSRGLTELSRREGVTLFMTLLAALQVLLHRSTGREDFVIGADMANRNRGETERLIGFFVNALPVRADLAGEPTFRELLARVRETTLGAYTHQDLPAERLVDFLQPNRAAGSASPFQVVLSFENTPAAQLAAGGLRFTPLDLSPDTAKRDLTLFVSETAEGITGSWNYSTDLFDAVTISRLAGRFELLLGDIVTRADASLPSLEICSIEERRREDVEKIERKDAKFAKFLSVKPQSVGTLGKDLVRLGNLREGQSLPLLITPALDGVDLTAWVRTHRDEVESYLSRHGGVLFRDFDVKSIAEFEQFALGVCDPLFGDYGDLPPEEDGRKVYQSTPYPADKTILFHNEGSHTHRWPLKQFFFCLEAAQQGGETPIVDCRAMYKRLDPHIIERFTHKKLLYVRNFTDGLDVSWQEFFKTGDRTEVERYCQRAAIELEWKENGLRTRQLSPAVVQHPKNGERVFFNQVQLHHVACLDPAVRESLLALYGEADLPRNVYYGDGSPIEDSVMEEISRAYWDTAVSFPWQEGDIILLDNMLTAHARNPFVGPRRIVVAMGEMIESSMVQNKGDL